MTEGPTAGKLSLVVVTYKEKILEVECDEVTLPGRLGYFGILPGHVPLLATLKVGELSYRVGKIEQFLALSWGFCEVADDVVSVMAEFAEKPEEIDVEAARREEAEAAALLASTTGAELSQALAKIEAATVRLRVASRLR